MKPLQKWQITKMFAISKNLGMAKEDLYAMAQVDESIKELDYYGANAVIAELERRQRVPPVRKRTAPRTQRPGGSTTGQEAKVWALMYQLKNLDKAPNDASLGERLCGIIKKELHMDATPEQPFAWMDAHSCNKLIEIVKNYIKSAQRKAGGDGG